MIDNRGMEKTSLMGRREKGGGSLQRGSRRFPLALNARFRVYTLRTVDPMLACHLHGLDVRS